MYSKLTAAQGPQTWDGVPGMCSGIGELLRVNGIHTIVFDNELNSGHMTLLDGSVQAITKIPFAATIEFLWDVWDNDGAMAFRRNGLLCISLRDGVKEYFTISAKDFEDDFGIKTGRFLTGDKILRVWDKTTDEHVMVDKDGSLQTMNNSWTKGVEAVSKLKNVGENNKSRKFHRRIR